MANLSDLIIQNPDVVSFVELEKLVIKAAQEGEIFLQFDVKPDFRDTPRDWHQKLEAAFYWGQEK